MRQIQIFILALFLHSIVFAHINPERDKAQVQGDHPVSLRNDCAPATAQLFMSINNVRALLLNGGDVWWNLSDGQYIIPKVDPASGQLPVSSIFAASVWLGGYDDAGNLKMAAQDYRNANGTNVDFWPGPLTPIGTTAKDSCLQWDRFWRVLGENIRTHLRNFTSAREAGVPYDCDRIPKDILAWPGKGNPFFEDFHDFSLPFDVQGLGAFHDEDGDELYNPCNGDYPVIEVRGCPEPNFPDEMIFWIYNDAGNIHTSTLGDPIRMEVQVQAFAYATNDELNDMTFQRYKLINRAVSSIDSTFFALWVDPDLGCHTDDFIGCDIERSLMYVYNEDVLDGTNGCDCPSFNGAVNTYCDEVPILGVDYFRGPRGPMVFTDTFPIDWIFLEANNNKAINHGRDIIQIFPDTTILNDTLKIVTGEVRVELGMSSFTYYNNGSIGTWPAGTTDPTTGSPIEWYRYMSGSWRDGTPVSFGGSGYNVPPGQIIDYAFPDPPNAPNPAWSMCTANLPFGDRRTIQASGPFRLDPGEVNELIIGVPWVPNIDYPCPDISRLLSADDIAQALFDQCFELPDGPDAPDLDFIELDRELIMVLTNDTVSSNNAFERYSARGLEIPPMEIDSNYRFEGYKIYQLAGPNVSTGELNNIEQARIVVQVDIKNGVNTLYNWHSIPNPDPNQPFLWIPEVQVEGGDEGIRHTFSLREDQFASEDRRLINHKKYYYTVIAYAYNNFDQFDPQTVIGQRRTYLEGRRNIKTYSPIPRPIVYRKLNSDYGEGAIVTRLSGEGAGQTFLDISQEVRESLLSSDFSGEIEYLPNASPIQVNIYNPLVIEDGSYEIRFFDVDANENTLSDAAQWRLTDLQTDETLVSERSIVRFNEQVFGQYGFSIGIGQSDDVGDQADESNGVIGDGIQYADPEGPEWFMALQDDFGGSPVFNFIKTNGIDTLDYHLDPTQAFSMFSFFYPYHITDYRYPEALGFPFLITPAWQDPFSASVRLRPGAGYENLNNIDIVLTKDKDKWSRCIVVETATRYYDDLGLSTEGNANQIEVRDVPSVGKEDADGDGRADADGAVDENGQPIMGMGWFPGYAVNVETGKRVNIFFGENSVYGPAFVSRGYPNIGTDLMWNPTSDFFVPPPVGNPTIFNFFIGGQHTIYVTDESYDGCEALRKDLRTGGTSFDKLRGLPKIKWACIPFLAPETELLSYQEGLIPNDCVIKIRIDNPYDMHEGLPEYNDYPAYLVEFRGVAADEVDEKDEINEALAAINVAPNPYYGFSEYETSQFTNTIKITNLPPECTVTIFSIDGRFIRQYKRNEAGENQFTNRANPGIPVTQFVPDLEWNLRNSKNIPIASGVYLIHVDAPGLGERVIKWFGVNRKFDPTGL